jgi:protease-4
MMFHRCLLVAALTVCAVAVPTTARAAETAGLAHIKLKGSLDETPVADDPLFGTSSENFKSKLDRIKKAKDDSKVQALYLEIDGLGIGRGKLHELRRAIADFRKTGKKAVAFLESGTAADYLVAIACDEVCVPESGWLMLTGVRAEMMFYKDLLDKIGVKADMLQMGEFKGAAEPLTRSSMSPSLRKQLEGLIDDFYEHDFIGLIVASRKGKELTPDKVKALIDEGPFSAKQAMQAGLIDRVAYPEKFQDSLKTTLKVDAIKFLKNYAKAKSEDIDLSNPFALFKLLAPPKTKKSSKTKVAVIYATGVIVSGRGGESVMGEDSCGSTTMIEAIREAEEDLTVKAIVLRVDSPGGSALASDLIWNELTRCKKPIIASMGDVAASGGYYISMASPKIFAEPGTLTGSIGVVGGKIALAGAFDKIGLKTEVISRGAHANILAGTSPFSESERKAMTALMRETYNQFLDKAIAGRAKAGKKFTREELIKFAEGRVWSGRQAKTHGLIDELGTLDDAIAAAKTEAKLEKSAEVELLILPRSKSFIEQYLDKADSRAPSLGAAKLPLVNQVPELHRHLRTLDGLFRLRSEPVWVMMPYRLEVR